MATTGQLGAGQYSCRVRRRELVLVLLVVAPPLVLALAGLAHPMVLDPRTGHRWHTLHEVLLPIFPFLGLGPLVEVRDEALPVRVLAGLLGFVFAVYYTALDVLAGIGAGALQQAGNRPAASVLFGQGNRLASYGVWAYLLASLIAAAMALIRNGTRAVPGGLLLIAGAISFLNSHIYWPRGVLTMVALTAGWGLLELARQPRGEAVAVNPV